MWGKLFTSTAAKAVSGGAVVGLVTDMATGSTVGGNTSGWLALITAIVYLIQTIISRRQKNDEKKKDG